jgi:putative ABC transport system permease protein
VASGPPLGINWRTATLRPPVTADSDERWDLDLLTVGYDYVETAGLELLAGRSFSHDFPSDPEEAVLITASAVERLGFDDDGLGETVDLFEEMTVVGVVEDFHNVSLKEPLKPTAILLDPTQTGHVLVRLATGRTEAGLAALERAWTALVPERPFVFEFLDEQIQAQYLAEERLSRVFGLFAGLAVALASLGLFGLAAFAAQQRTKEIGIRKVLGANVVGLVALLSKDFLRLVAFAFVLGAPVAYFAMQRWLDDFAYRIQIGPGLFLLLGALALGVAIAAVSYQSIRAALAEPVESLRYE